MSDAVYTFGFEAGLLVRRTMLATLKGSAMQLGLDFQHVEDRGLLGSAFHVRVTGRAEDLTRYAQATAQYLRQSEGW